MEKKWWTGVLMMCAAMAYGQQNPYYNVIVSGDGALELDESFRNLLAVQSNKKLGKESRRTFRITAMPPVGDAVPGRRRQDFLIDGTPLSTTTDGGVVVAMSHDGRNVGLAQPEFDLHGEADWITLSLYYQTEVLKLLPFTDFLSLDKPAGTNEMSVVALHVKPSCAIYACGTSGKMRAIEYYKDSAKINRIIGRKGEPQPSASFEDIEKLASKWSVVFTAEFDNNSGYLTFFARECMFCAEFFPNGGLRSLYEDVSERKWNEKGELIHERDLKKDPYPDFDLEDVIMLKGGREI